MRLATKKKVTANCEARPNLDALLRKLNMLVTFNTPMKTFVMIYDNWAEKEIYTHYEARSNIVIAGNDVDARIVLIFTPMRVLWFANH